MRGGRQQRNKSKIGEEERRSKEREKDKSTEL